MLRRSRTRSRAVPALAMLALGTGLLVSVGGSSSADVTAVNGSAYGYSLTVSLFGGPQPPIGPTPTVTLPAGGSAVPVTASALTGSASAGPARFFSSGPITVSTQGTPAGGGVTSSADLQTLNTSGQEALTATALSSTCTASETDISGSTTITGGTLVTDSGDDDPTNTIPDHPPVTVNLPADPAPNTPIEGHIHVNGATDTFRYIFNEQVETANGITVNAAHQFLIGPTAVGDLYIGQSRCGVTVVPGTTTT
ncbi:MAG: hypothetical protein H0T70_10635, partial [Acidimicrobiia bacterium]|nr:hypothetical protein [Acidimicrobiia bacterium]